MVFLTKYLRLPVKILKDGGTLYEDAARLYVRGGDGGRGLRVCGGVGGDGGDVILRANKRTTMERLAWAAKKRFVAGNGYNSTKLFVLGNRGKDLEVPVPAGVTVCTDEDRELYSLNKVGEKVIVAKGGEGGSPTNDYVGQKAIPHLLRVYLKLIADVSFVGFPNAGKSTMLKALSKAKPQISSFPFTTVRPQVGILEYEDGRKISLADLPGLIEGSYKNVGLGHRFLRHIERTTVMMVMVDVNGFKLDNESPYRTAFETLVLLNKELELFNDALIDKPAILCINKMDAVGAERKLNVLLENIARFDERVCELDEEIRPTKLLRFVDTIPLCARDYMAEPMQRLRTRIREMLDEIDEKKRKDMGDQEVLDRSREKQSGTSLV